jgi:hypothetical protein
MTASSEHVTPREGWQARVEEEHKELKGRVERLQAFIDAPGFLALPSIECDDLQIQLTHMRAYLATLARRIKRFKADSAHPQQ